MYTNKAHAVHLLFNKNSSKPRLNHCAVFITILRYSSESYKKSLLNRVCKVGHR